jgi:cystathionine beta-lyase family protein involved in aluminum resistance
MNDLYQQIADLEAEIDDLSEAVERCRKSMIVARVAIIAGVLLVGASLAGLVQTDALVLVIGIAATLAGIGLLGSSRGSLEQITGKIRAFEARRDGLIDGMNLQTVQGS